MQVSDAGGLLVFSLIGYKPVEIPLGTQSVLNATLQADVQALAVHAERTTVKRSAVAGSVSISPAVANDAMEPQWNTEEYDAINENIFHDALRNPLSTFSIDVDAASYPNIRRFLNNGQRPPKDAVRIEEMINYFTYDYEQPSDEHPFAIYTEMAPAPLE